MKKSRPSLKTKPAAPVIDTLPLMANVTVLPPEESIEITGAVERGLNIVNITYQASRPASIRCSEKALRALLRLVAEIKLRGGESIVTAIDLQREGVVPWGTACTAMTEVFESIATVVGGVAAKQLLGIWWGTEEGEPPWSRKGWSDHFASRFDLDFEEDDRKSSRSTIRERLGSTRPPSGNKAFLRANGWRPDFAYLHGHTSPSKEKSPDGVDLAYSLNCASSSLTYNRAALLRHDDAVVRQIAAILPI